MKTLVISIGLLFVTTAISFAQTTIVYDFKNGIPPMVTDVEYGQAVTLKIENINRFLYDVKIDSKQVKFPSEPPPLLSQVLKLEKVEGSTTNLPVEKSVNTAVELYNNTTHLREIKKELNFQNSLPDTAKDEVNIKELSTKIEELSTKIEELIKTIDEQNKQISDLKNQLKGEYLKREADLFSKFLILQSSFEHAKLSKVLKNKLILIATTDGLNLNNAKSKIKELVKQFPFCNNPEDLALQFESAYNDFKTTYELFLLNKVAQDTLNKTPELKDKIRNLMQEAESIKSAYEKANFNDVFYAISYLSNQLKNPNNYFVVSAPVQAEQDIVKFIVSVGPRKDVLVSSGLTGAITLTEREFSISIPVIGGIKLGFSTGLFVASGLHERGYHTEKVSTDTTLSKIAENQNNTQVQPSIGTLLHVFHRTTRDIKIGITFGFGINSKDITDANIFIGPCIILGEEQIFAFSLGLSLAKVNYLKGQYETGKEYKTKDLNGELTEKVMRAGFFVGLSVNLIGNRE